MKCYRAAHGRSQFQIVLATTALYHIETEYMSGVEVLLHPGLREGEVFVWSGDMVSLYPKP
jgi:hypothetical protein